VPAPVELKRGTGSSTNRSPNLQHCKALWIIRVPPLPSLEGATFLEKPVSEAQLLAQLSPLIAKKATRLKSSDPLRVLQSNLASDANLVRGGFGNSLSVC
jgi:hypothetical protein